MGLINYLKGLTKHPALSEKHSSITRSFGNNSRRLESGEFFNVFSSGKNADVIEKDVAFLVPEVNSILNKRATAHSSARIQVVNKNTLKPVENDLAKLLRNPNWFQGQKEFIRQSNLLHDLYGNEYIYMLFPFGFNPTRTKALYNLHPGKMKIKYKSENLYYKETSQPDDLLYLYNIDNKEDEIKPNEIIHLNDNRVKASGTDGSLLKGQSKIDALSRPINNIIDAYEARGVLIRNRGALGILSNDSKDGIGATLDIDEKEKENLQREYSRYGITDNQWQIIITSLSLKWQQMGVNVGDLKLFEEVREDALKVAEGFNYPPELLGRAEGSANIFGDNKKESEKNWYQDSIIPEVQERVDAMNKAFNTDSQSYTIIATFDHLPIFQKDIKERAATMTLVTNALSRAYADKAITLEEYQNELRKYGFIE